MQSDSNDKTMYYDIRNKTQQKEQLNKSEQITMTTIT